MAKVDVHIFHCGQGDTILLHLNEKAWVLIDCNLPGKPARTRFFELVKALRVPRLDLVILTHPDADHYTGMKEVMEHFASPSRGLGTFCDSGFLPKLLQGKVPAELVGLYETILRLESAGRLKYQTLGAHQDTRAQNADWPQELLVVSPVNSRSQLATLRAILRDDREGPNEYSVVLTLEIGEPTRNFQGLFPGDAGGETLQAALQRMPGKAQPSPKFDFVKVAHHGSWHSHANTPVIEAIRARRKSVAIVSSRNTSATLPRREVLSDYLKAGWRVYDTGRRDDPAQGSELVHALAWRHGTCSHYDITLSWCARAGLKVEPDLAEVLPGHLAYYPAKA